MAAEKDYLRIGKISTIDYKNGTAKITYEDKDNSTTASFSFLAWQYWMPKIGDQVLVAHLSNGTSTAVILGPVWHDGNRPPEGFEGLFRKDLSNVTDRAFVRYDDTAEAFKLKVGKTVIEITNDGSVIVTAPEGITLNGQVAVSGDVAAGGISLSGHTHPGDSGGTTGAPG